jgi:cAMP-dependent protein kinase regulator
MREEVQRLKAKKQELSKRGGGRGDDSASSNSSKGKKRNDESSSDSECDDEYLDEVAEPLNPSKAKEMAQRQNMRTSVSAEVFGKFNIKEAF